MGEAILYILSYTILIYVYMQQLGVLYIYFLFYYSHRRTGKTPPSVANYSGGDRFSSYRHQGSKYTPNVFSMSRKYRMGYLVAQ